MDPVLGIAMIEDAGGSKRSTKAPLLAHLPYNDSGAGVVMSTALSVGSTVIYAKDPMVNIGYILGFANRLAADLDNPMAGRALYNLNSIASCDDESLWKSMHDLLSVVDANLVLANCHGHNVDMDALPGDCDMLDYKGEAGIHIGKYVTQLRGSTLAYIDLAGISNKIRMVASTIEQHTDTVFNPISDDLVSYNIAVNTSESLGIIYGNAPIAIDGEAGEDLTLFDKEAIPFYRIQRKEGDLVSGTESMVVMPAVEGDMHKKDTEPIILSKQRTSLHGNITEASTYGILSVKTPTIMGMHQVGYGKEFVDKDTDPDILQAYEVSDEKTKEKPKVPEEDIDRIRDAALDKFIEYALSDYFVDKLKERLAQRGLSLSSDKATFDKAIWGEDKDINGYGPTTDAVYPPPAKVTLTDSRTGEKFTYYRSTSFVSQEPDGSILLKDGYGSEIRMSQGNIYISPALDLFLRPGRDLSAMTPRHQSFNSQYSCTINSGDSIYIRAADNLKAIAGTSGGGILTIENQSTASLDDKVPGINIRSAIGVAMTGAHVYIGGKPSSDLTRKSIKPDEEVASTIILDSGSNGSMLLKSGACTMDAKQYVFACHDGSFANEYTGFASALTISPSFIGMYTTTVIMPAHLSLSGLKDIETVTLYSGGEQKTLNLKTADAPTMTVAGNFMCYSQGIFKQGVAANGVVSISNENALAHKNPTKAKEFFTKIVARKDEVNGIFGKACATSVKYAAEYGPYQNWFVNGNSFSFPLSYNVDTTITIPGMCWQRDTYNNAADGYKEYVWSEKYIKDAEGKDTACYPGIDIWEKAQVSVGKDIKIPLASDYITNTAKKEYK
jgi:hypothetical protein